VLRSLAAVATAMLSQAGLWAEVYLVTALVLDAIHGRVPSQASLAGPAVQGMKKAMVFSGLFMAAVHVPDLLGRVSEICSLAQSDPVLVATLLGALSFPLLKTVIESFDGSPPFFQRLGKSYRNPILYLRGAVVGCGLGYWFAEGLSQTATPDRVAFGFAVGVAAFAGVDLLRDGAAARRQQGRLQPLRVYIVHGLLGGFVGAAVGFYFDAAQVEAVGARFQGYLAAGATPRPFIENVLLSKWGTVHLGEVTGGVSLLFAQSLLGVLTWAIPAWLFALNRTFLAAYFRKEAAPITGLFTRDGLVALTQNMIEVLRWGLWMSPIINSFLRPTGEPTWYNQDGTVCTVVALYHDVTLSPEAFREWSLQVFVALLAYDWVRVLIWLDHFGLRVATLVNLSFAEPARVGQGEQGLTITRTANEIRTTVAITLPGADDPVELWTVTVENLANRPREIKVVPYLEWVLNRPPTGGTPSTTGCSPRWSTSPACKPCSPGTSTSGRWASSPRTPLRRGSSPRGSTSSAAPAASGHRGPWRRWPSRTPWTPTRTRPSTRSAAC
jgi:cyclic beta-1,2-glucan synthetase